MRGGREGGGGFEVRGVILALGPEKEEFGLSVLASALPLPCFFPPLFKAGCCGATPWNFL